MIGGTTGVTVGGSCTGACNLISGNTGLGLLVSSDQVIEGPGLEELISALMTEHQAELLAAAEADAA